MPLSPPSHAFVLFLLFCFNFNVLNIGGGAYSVSFPQRQAPPGGVQASALDFNDNGPPGDYPVRLDGILFFIFIFRVSFFLFLSMF